MNEIVLFALGVTAQRYGVLVHACCVLSNHLHLVITDVEGRLPDFMRDLNSMIARAVNALLGRFESFWAKDGGTYSAVEPMSPAAILDKIAYVLANPVAAGLVERGAEWPGLWTAPEQIGTAKLVANKPKEFFDPDGTLPDSVELELTVPPGFASADDFRERLAAELRQLEGKHRQELAAKGRRVLGVARILAQSPFSRPATFERRFGVKPRAADPDRSRRMLGVSTLKRFEEEYRRARTSWCAGLREVIFPAGTWLMRIMFGVQCAGAA